MKNIAINTKTCKDCSVTFSIAHITGRGRNVSYCDTCREVPSYKRYRDKNREKENERARIYRDQNLELCRERCRKSQVKVNDRKRFGGLRALVTERDNWTCQKCDTPVSLLKGVKRVVVHHIDHDKKNNTMENLQTLCQPCHARHHYSLEKHQLTSTSVKGIWKEKGARGFNR